MPPAAVADDDDAYTLGDLAVGALTLVAPYAATLAIVVAARGMAGGQTLAEVAATLSAATVLKSVVFALIVHGIVTLPLCWLVAGRERVLSLALVAVVAGPMLVAWAHKLAYYAGRWLATGNADLGHEFVPTLTDSMVRSAHMLHVDGIVVGMVPYRTVGLAPTMQHWRMGAMDSANLCVYALALYVAVRIGRRVVSGVRAAAVARRRARTRAPTAGR